MPRLVGLPAAGSAERSSLCGRFANSSWTLKYRATGIFAISHVRVARHNAPEGWGSHVGTGMTEPLTRSCELPVAATVCCCRGA